LDRDWFQAGLVELYSDANANQRSCDEALARLDEASAALSAAGDSLSSPGLREGEIRKLLESQTRLRKLRSAYGTDSYETWQALFRAAVRDGFSGSYPEWRESTDAQAIERGARRTGS
jgi:homoserine acetyltransferase